MNNCCDHNAEVTRARIGIECAIYRIEQSNIMTKPYHGTHDRFNDEINVFPGLANLKWG